MKENGFTLIELIIIIVLIGLAASLLISTKYGISHSSDPLMTLKDNYAVLQAIEKVNAHYRDQLEKDSHADISMYARRDVATVVTGLESGMVSGSFTSFSAPNASREVDELSAAGTRYVLITAQKNNSRMVTLLGN